MKNLISLLSLTLLLITTSCSKGSETYTCGCSDGTPNIVHEEVIDAENESEAKEICNSKGFECWLL